MSRRTLRFPLVVSFCSNGQGKTNLVEAINFLSTLGSHRSNVESALIRTGAAAAIIRVQLTHEAREILLEAQLNREGINKAQFNRSAAKLRDFPRYISTVLFAPEDLMLIRGEPSGRRKFMDELVVDRTPRLAAVFNDYDRSLKQRNTLLKTARQTTRDSSQLSTLDIWDERLVALGSEIMVERERLVRDLAGPLAHAYHSIAGSGHQPELVMRNSVGETNATGSGGLTIAETVGLFQAALAASRSSEIERGMTLVGPHRDDVEFSLNALPAKGYASHGETWSFALSLRLAAARLLRSESILGDPILILDDVFAELDTSRRERLALAVSDFEQVFITSAVGEDVPASLLQQVFAVESGTIRRVAS